MNRTHWQFFEIFITQDPRQCCGDFAKDCVFWHILEKILHSQPLSTDQAPIPFGDIFLRNVQDVCARQDFGDGCAQISMALELLTVTQSTQSCRGFPEKMKMKSLKKIESSEIVTRTRKGFVEKSSPSSRSEC